MMVYPIVFSFVAFIAIIYLYQRVYSKKSPASYILWGLIWLFIILFAFAPELSNPIGRFFGISRGLDFLVIVAIILIFYLIFKLYMKIDKLQQDMTKIVREIALNNEITEKSDDDKK